MVETFPYQKFRYGCNRSTIKIKLTKLKMNLELKLIRKEYNRIITRKKTDLKYILYQI